MACEPLVQPSNDGDELLKQDRSKPVAVLQRRLNTVDEELYGPSWPCGQDGGHPMLWSHYVVQYLLVSAYVPLLSTGSLHT